MRHRNLPLFCVQYHPEASPGPHDSHYLFKDFVKMMEEWKGVGGETSVAVFTGVGNRLVGRVQAEAHRNAGSQHCNLRPLKATMTCTTIGQVCLQILVTSAVRMHSL